MTESQLPTSNNPSNNPVPPGQIEDKQKKPLDAASVSNQTITGDNVHGDKISGDKVKGDKTTVNVENGIAVVGDSNTVVGERGVNVAGNVYGSINTGTINNFIEGTQSYMPEFTTAVKDFLYIYLGDEDNPVPFGGRNDALAQLEQWRTNADASPCLLLTAPAGRGKSALLVRWSAYLQAQQDVAVVFMPISIRFNTNQETDTFSLLATRLARLYGKEIPAKWGNFPASAWRRLVAEYLQEPLPDGRHLLLIMDGLDEAAWEPGADLFPHRLPERIRLVISARFRGGEEPGPAPWLRLLDWDDRPQMANTMELESLTQTGVQDVLERMGYRLDEISQNVDIVSELYRLSDGDPLLVELYVKDLWQRGVAVTRLQPEDLQDIQPGYKGYFEKWWEYQKRLWGQDDPMKMGLVTNILEVLSMALGPLTTRDLRQLLPGKVRSRDLKRAIHPLNRFVIGDGQEHGYIFSHPKLGEYFRDDLEPDEQAEWQARFLAWGEQILAELQSKQIQPRDASHYLMLYYGHHLEESNATIEAMLQLLSWEWIQIWHEKTGAYAGFLQDVDRVWMRLRAANNSAITQGQPTIYLGQEIICALCHASVNSIAENIPNELLFLLLQHGIWTEKQVLVYARQRIDIRKRIEAFALLREHLSETTWISVGKEILTVDKEIWEEKWWTDLLEEIAPNFPQEALLSVQDIHDDWLKATVLAIFAPYLPEKTLEIARNIEDEWARSFVLKALVLCIPEKILVMAQEIKDEWCRASLLKTLAPHMPENSFTAILEDILALAVKLPEEGQVDIFEFLVPFFPEEILAAAVKIRNQDRQANLLIAVAPHLPQKTLIAANQLQDELYRTVVHIALAPHVSREICTNLLEEAKAFALNLPDEHGRAYIFKRLALHFPEEILSATLETLNGSVQAEVLLLIAPYLPEKTLDSLSQIDPNWNLSRVFIVLAPLLPQKTLELAQQMLNSMSLVEVLKAVAPYLPEAVLNVTKRASFYRDDLWASLAAFLPHETFAMASELQDEKNGVNALIALAPHLPQKVFQATKNIDDEEKKIKVLMKLAAYLPMEVLATAKSLEHNKRQARLMVAVVQYLPNDLQTSVLKETVATIQQINDICSQTRLLISVTQFLQGNIRKVALEEALLRAQKIYEQYSWVDVLIDLAPYMPQQILTQAEKMHDKEEQIIILLALIPHWPQGILAALQNIDNDQRNNELLLALAPYLPQEILAITRTIESNWKQTKLLIALAPHLPEKILEFVRELPFTRSQQLEIFVAVVPHLSQEMRSSKLSAALATIQEIEDQTKQADLLLSLAVLFPQEAFALLEEIKNENKKVETLIAIAPFMPQEVLAISEQIQDENKRLEVLTAITPHFPQEVLENSKGIQDKKKRIEILLTIIPHLPQEIHKTVIADTLEIIYDLQEKKIQAEMLITLVPHLPEEIRKTIVQEVLMLSLEVHNEESIWIDLVGRAEIWEFDHERTRGTLFTKLIEHLLLFSRSHLYDLWQETLPILSRHIRPDFLSDVEALIPIIHYLGGKKAVRDTWKAVQNASAWWP